MTENFDLELVSLPSHLIFNDIYEHTFKFLQIRTTIDQNEDL